MSLCQLLPMLDFRLIEILIARPSQEKANPFIGALAKFDLAIVERYINFFLHKK